MAISKENTSYLLILNWDGSTKFSVIKETFQNCFTGKEHFEILLFSPLKKLNEALEIPSRMYLIPQSAYSILGKLKSKKSLPTEYTHFDVAILLDTFSKKDENAIKQLKIKHVVAFDYERDFVEINLIQSKELPIEKVNFAKHILTKISD